MKTLKKLEFKFFFKQEDAIILLNVTQINIKYYYYSRYYVY